MNKSVWFSTKAVPLHEVVLFYHPWYSHVGFRLGFFDRDGLWLGVKTDGSTEILAYEPTHWMHLPEPPND